MLSLSPKKQVMVSLIATALVAGVTRAQDEVVSDADTSKASNTKSEQDDDNIIRKPKDLGDPATREFSSSERSKACAKFNGKLVSLGGEMWKIVQCTRHQVHDADVIFKMSRQGVPVIEADSRDLAAIPVGQSWETLQNAKQRRCETFNGRYVTYSFTDIYFVERCFKRLIPDHETYLQHRKDRGSKAGEITELTDAEFYSMKQGRDISSVIDKEFAKLLDGSAGVDIVPIDEACKGVEGRFVSFYSRLYKIEKCHKREIDAEAFTLKRRGADQKLIELRAEQWLSMPDGKPWIDK